MLHEYRRMKSSLFVKAILAFFIFPFMAYEGVERGAKYGSIDESHTQVMVVTSLRNANGREFFPDYQATGTLPSGAVATVSIFKREFQQFRPGEKIAVLAVPSTTESYITASKFEESKPFIPVGPVTVTWHFPVAVLGWLLMLFYITKVWLSARREQAT